MLGRVPCTHYNTISPCPRAVPFDNTFQCSRPRLLPSAHVWSDEPNAQFPPLLRKPSNQNTFLVTLSSSLDGQRHLHQQCQKPKVALRDRLLLQGTRGYHLLDHRRHRGLGAYPGAGVSGKNLDDRSKSNSGRNLQVQTSKESYASDQEGPLRNGQLQSVRHRSLPHARQGHRCPKVQHLKTYRQHRRFLLAFLKCLRRLCHFLQPFVAAKYQRVLSLNRRQTCSRGSEGT
mmetsp:Transcript_38014/g.56541  ORF Transcript_38014/g.56541 Transcript_38014/m.56541 type:complete len:231 (-) Transcript_38014:2188-2880(-)